MFVRIASQYLFKLCTCCLAIFLLANCAFAKNASGLAYAGVEFYGSSQITRMELEKELGLKLGASLEAVGNGVERLNQKLALKHVNAQVQIVQAPPDRIYVVVDVPDATFDSQAPTRRLKNPHHVIVRSKKPFLLMDQLEARLNKLTNEGRPWSESLKDGLKYYSDEPANLIVEQMLKQVPDMREELLAVIASDPDPNRRRRSVELLHWAGATPDTCYQLIPAIDDADPGVRTSVSRYLFPRLELLPDNFPLQDLVESFSRQLNRPSHQDRSKALYCLLALSGQHPELSQNIRVFSEERLRELSQQSQIPSIKNSAEKLLGNFRKQSTNSQTQPKDALNPAKESIDTSGF